MHEWLVMICVRSPPFLVYVINTKHDHRQTEAIKGDIENVNLEILVSSYGQSNFSSLFMYGFGFSGELYSKFKFMPNKRF